MFDYVILEGLACTFVGLKMVVEKKIGPRRVFSLTPLLYTVLYIHLLFLQIAFIQFFDVKNINTNMFKILVILSKEFTSY